MLKEYCKSLPFYGTSRDFLLDKKNDEFLTCTYDLVKVKANKLEKIELLSSYKKYMQDEKNVVSITIKMVTYVRQRSLKMSLI